MIRLYRDQYGQSFCCTDLIFIISGEFVAHTGRNNQFAGFDFCFYKSLSLFHHIHFGIYPVFYRK